MFEAYVRTRRIVALATIAVLLASAIIVSAFYRRILVPCRGGLEAVALSELPPRSGRNDVPRSDGVYVDYEEPHFFSNDLRSYRNVHLWLDEPCACKSELPIRWDPEHNPLHQHRPNLLGVYRNVETGLYVVHESAGGDVLAFRRTDVRGHAFKWRNAIDASSVSMLIFLGAFGALLGAYVLLSRGSRHAQWTNDTHRRFRDARALAALATVTVALAVGAHLHAVLG